MATVLIAVTLVPALEAVQTGVLGAGIYEREAIAHQRLLAKLEETLAEPFGTLELAAAEAGSPVVPSRYSDPPASESRRLVLLAGYDADDADGDGDPFTGADEGLLWMRVEVQGTSRAMETLTTR